MEAAVKATGHRYAVEGSPQAVTTRMTTGSITLGDVAARTQVLAVGCNRCDRAGRYPVAKLIETYGAVLPVPLLLRTLSADCPKREAASLYDICGIHCPGPPALFLWG